MEWTIFLLWLKLKTSAFCSTNYPFENYCQEEVSDCVLDGESFYWCTGDYRRRVRDN